MDWLDSIKEIKKAQTNNQLVVFVGAGVSKNSELPSWGELVNSIADKIEYYHQDYCSECDKRNSECTKKDCESKYNFSQDEFLRIPEYFYQADKSKEHNDYYNFIVSVLDSNKKSNPIDDEIFNLLPHHIITTNYDQLLENSDNSNTPLYTVVSKDSDLLSKASERYIIKMHGDLSSPETIVLKESDYINYEQEHPLICTYIKSLLVNHTFLFLGYSLNDYNLNLIIGWINYFQKQYGVGERPKNFLVDFKTPTEYESLRQKSKNIYVLDVSEMPAEIIEKACVPESLKSNVAKNLFSYLRAITDPKTLEDYVPLEKILEEKYEVLNSYDKISFDDLIQIQSLGRTDFAGTELVLYDESWYKKIVEIIKSDNKKIIAVFEKAGITAIHNFNNDTSCEIPARSNIVDKKFELYLLNDYLKLKQALESDCDLSEELYYLHYLGEPQSKIDSVIELEKQKSKSWDYISILLWKMRNRLAKITILDRQEALSNEINKLIVTVPEKYRKAIGYLKMLYESSAKNLIKMQELLDKQEKRNEYGKQGWESGHAFIHIWRLQSFAYDYYYFFKKNHLPLDYFSDVEKYLSYYIQAILCSYTPVAPSVGTDAFGITTHHCHYQLNSIDLDIIVKYTDPKALDSWLKKYSVQNIEFDDEVDASSKYINLCESFIEIPHQKWPSHILNFTKVVCLTKFDEQTKNKIFTAFIDVFEKAAEKSASIVEALFDSFFHLSKHFETTVSKNVKERALNVLLNDEVFKIIKDRHSSQLFSVLKDYAPMISKENQKKQIAIIEGQDTVQKKIQEIYQRRFIIPMENYCEFLNNNISQMQARTLFNLLIESIIPFSNQIQERLLSILKDEDEKRKKAPNTRSYPDWLLETLDEYIILKLLNVDVDISLLKPYAEYSLPLQFILEPEGFDYTKVDTNNYMWQNLIYSKEYGTYFLQHKTELLDSGLENIFSLGLETKAQEKIVYGLLLNDDELRTF